MSISRRPIQHPRWDDRPEPRPTPKFVASKLNASVRSAQAMVPAQSNFAIQPSSNQGQTGAYGLTSASSHANGLSGAVPHFPAQTALPKWVMTLLATQRASIVLSLTLTSVVLLLYGWTVYTQQLWGKEYQKLELLRRNERQLTSHSEVLKNQIAKQADRPGISLVPPTSEGLLFLNPAIPRTNPQKPAAEDSPSTNTPAGY